MFFLYFTLIRNMQIISSVLWWGTTFISPSSINFNKINNDCFRQHVAWTQCSRATRTRRPSRQTTTCSGTCPWCTPTTTPRCRAACPASRARPGSRKASRTARPGTLSQVQFCFIDSFVMCMYLRSSYLKILSNLLLLIKIILSNYVKAVFPWAH